MSFFISGLAGNIEALITEPMPNIAPIGIAIFCHPNPVQGGTMHNKVVHTAAKAFNQRDIICVRFNFRGVGKSEGVYGEVEGEYQDLVAVVDWVKREYPDLPIYLGGFSFGAYIAARFAFEHADKLMVKQLISIAPGMGRLAKMDFEWFLAQGKIDFPWTILMPEADEVVSAPAVFDWFARLALKMPTAQLIKFPETSHFFHGKLVELREALISVIV